MSYEYEFRTTDGRSCCASDDLDHLCEHCRAAARKSNDSARRTTNDQVGRALQGYGSYQPDPPPDPYAKGRKADSVPDRAWLNAMKGYRQQFYDHASTSVAAARQPATSRVHLNPPDPYQLALDRMKEQR